MKKHLSFSFFIGLTAALTIAVFCCFSACKINLYNNIQIADTEKEPISEADILGNYDGAIIIFMNDFEFGFSQEKIEIRKSPITNELFLKTRKKTVYPTHIDLGYLFKKITLNADADGKGFTFSADSGELFFYDKNGNTPTSSIDPIAKPVILKNGYIYKKAGKVYIRYTVDYNMTVIREAIPLLPEGHKSLSSIMKDGKKQ